MKVAWVLINVSHYHVARWRAFAQRSVMDAIMVEIASRDAGFDALSAGDAGEFERVTLFPGKTWREVSGRHRRAAIRATLNRLMPDVVCINGWSIGGDIASLQWAMHKDKHVVVFSDSNRFDRSRWKAMEWLKKRLVTLADAGLAGGTASRAYLKRWYRHAACFIHPSTTEQWGLVVNQAMASGLPVLVSERCGCALDLVENGRNGFTFDPYDVDALAGLMERIASPDCDQAAIGTASLEIIERWSPETFASGLEEAIQAALEGAGRRAGLLDRALLRALSHRCGSVC